MGKDISPLSAKLAWGLGLPSYIPTVSDYDAQLPAEKKYKSYTYTTWKHQSSNLNQDCINSIIKHFAITIAPLLSQEATAMVLRIGKKTHMHTQDPKNKQEGFLQLFIYIQV